jgi:hypothetical protein
MRKLKYFGLEDEAEIEKRIQDWMNQMKKNETNHKMHSSYFLR